MNREQATDLADLKFHWDEVYDIAYDEATGRWKAHFRDEPESGSLFALTPEQLRDMIREDYAYRGRQLRRSECDIAQRMSL